MAGLLLQLLSGLLLLLAGPGCLHLHPACQPGRARKARASHACQGLQAAEPSQLAAQVRCLRQDRKAGCLACQ